MAIPDYEPDDVVGDPVHVLRTLLANFSLSPLRTGKCIRVLLQKDHVAFRKASLVVLREPMDERGLRYLITVLWTKDLLISILGDVSLPRELSISIAQTAVKVDTQLHIRLTTFLMNGMLEGRDVEEKSANRLLEVLGSISDGSSIEGFLRQMAHHPNPRIRSKISWLLGNGGRGSTALKQIIMDPDEDGRVRANAVETLWRNREPDVLEIFAKLVDDPNCRVAGNSAFGAYLAGDIRSIAIIRRMVGHDTVPFRQTAAWVIGRTEDPRFLPDVGRLLGEKNESLRKAVFRAVASIKNAAARRSKNAPIVLTVISIGRSETGQARVRLSLAGCELGVSPQISATGFFIKVDGSQVEEFSCAERRNAQIFAAFVLPRRQLESDALRASMRRGLTECLEVKLVGDRWGIVRYHESARGDAQTNSLKMFGQAIEETERSPEKKGSMTLTDTPAILRAHIESNGILPETAATLFEGINRAVLGLKGLRIARYVLVFLDGNEEMDPSQFVALEKLIEEFGVVINAISMNASPQLEKLCASSSGVFHLVANVADVEFAAQYLYQSFKSEYIVEFPLPAAASSSKVPVSIQVYDASAFGEVTLQVGEGVVAEVRELVETSA